MFVDRRAMLKTAVGAAWLGGATACSEARSSGGRHAIAQTRPRSGPFISTRDGTQLFHLDWGSGPPVVFLHAWALNSNVWEYQMGELVENGLRCIAYDRRGHGRSPDPGHGYDFDTLAEDLAAVLEHLDLRGVTLVGHSMGSGEIARYLSLHGSDRVARLVMVSMVGPSRGSTPGSTALAAFLTAMKTDRPAALAGGLGLFVGTHRQLSPEMSQWPVAQFLACSPRAALGCMSSIAEGEHGADLGAIRLPTLIVHGDDDALSSLDGNARSAAQLIAGSRLEVYAGGPHGLVITDKERFNGDLLAFVRG